VKKVERLHARAAGKPQGRASLILTRDFTDARHRAQLAQASGGTSATSKSCAANFIAHAPSCGVQVAGRPGCDPSPCGPGQPAPLK
jgi:hypothetical protein